MHLDLKEEEEDLEIINSGLILLVLRIVAKFVAIRFFRLEKLLIHLKL